MIVNECVHAYQAAMVSTPSDSAYHTLGMDTEVVDSGGYHDNVTNNSRLTFAGGGLFLVFAAPAMANPGGVVLGRLAINGVGLVYEYAVDGNAASPTGIAGPLLFWMQNFAPGDYIESQIKNTSGGNDNAWTQMAALKIEDPFSCHITSSTLLSTSPMTFNTTIYDPNGMQTSASVVTIKKAGYYLCLVVKDDLYTSWIEKNGAGVMNGSYSEGVSSADYAVDWLEVGDTLEVVGVSFSPIHSRQFVVAYLGGANSCLAYTYFAADLNNSALPPDGDLETDSEWFDPCGLHPFGGDGLFRMSAGYHFGLTKISTDGGPFLQNDAAYMRLNGSQLGNIVSDIRHSAGASPQNTTLAFACFQAADGDTFTGNWLASTLFAATAFTPYTNVFVTDTGAAVVTNPLAQIYRRR